MSPETLSNENLGQNERAVNYLTQWYSQPLLTGLWERWGWQELPNKQTRNWLVCGPGRNAFSRILNWHTGVPILENGDPHNQEHFKLSPSYLYHNPASGIEDVDHEFLSYFNGKGDVIHIDVTYPVMFGDKRGLTGADNLQGGILMRKFRVDEYENALHNIYHLYPFDLESDLVKKFFSDHNHPPQNQEEHDDYLRACYTDRITNPHPLPHMQNDDPYERMGPPLAEFIRTFIPEWNGIR